MTVETTSAAGTIRALLVEDNSADARLLQYAVRDDAASIEIDHVERLRDALERLAAGGVDIVLLDLSLPDASELEGLGKVVSVAPSIPVVVLTGMSDEQLAVSALRAGAQDYLVKGEQEGARLIRSLRHAMERRRLISELDEMRRHQLELKDEFISHVSHELRSPLTAVHQFVTILLEGLAGEINDEQREYLEIALRNVNQLRVMIGDLLEVTRARTGKLTIRLQRTAIGDVLHQAVDTYRETASRKGVALIEEPPASLPPALADPDRLGQVVRNLLDNAIKFTPPGGTVRFGARIAEEDSSFLCVEVSDTGPGVPPEEAARIFEPLYQSAQPIDRSRRGLGLGLYICRELVRRQGGRLSVDSETGRGSTFRFTVPVFSLSGVLSSILTVENLRKSSAALIRVLVDWTGSRPKGEKDEATLSEAWNTVRDCILPGLDVLLPRMAPTPRGEKFHVVAFADADGAGVIAERIRNQLARRIGSHGYGVQTEVSTIPVRIDADEADTSSEVLIQACVSQVESWVQRDLHAPRGET